MRTKENAMEDSANRLYLAGELAELPAYSHTCCGSRFFRFSVAVLRKSGVADVLPALSEERLLPPFPQAGDPITVAGQLRAYCQHTQCGNKLHIMAFAREIHVTEAEHDNRVCLRGQLIKPPVFRCTPLGREITDLFVSVPRAFNKSDLLPVIAWGRNARMAHAWQCGDTVIVEGRLQSRPYTKRQPDGSEQTMLAYEVSAANVSRA